MFFMANISKIILIRLFLHMHSSLIDMYIGLLFSFHVLLILSGILEINKNKMSHSITLTKPPIIPGKNNVMVADLSMA